jgi:hypothetical protein
MIMDDMMRSAEIENSTDLIQNTSELVNLTDYHLVSRGIKFSISLLENRDKLREALYEHVSSCFEEFLESNYPETDPNLMNSITQGRIYVESHREEILKTSVRELARIIESCPENYQN